MSRIPLATDLKTRTGAPDKDARLKNAYVEARGDQSVVRKRPQAQGGVAVGTGTAQGGYGNVLFWGDTPYVITPNTGTPWSPLTNYVIGDHTAIDYVDYWALTDHTNSQPPSANWSRSYVPAVPAQWNSGTTGFIQSVYDGNHRVAWNGSIYCMIGQNLISGYAFPITSSNGISWTAHSDIAGLSYGGGSGYSICWNGTVFLAVGLAGAGAGYWATSTDGISWTTYTDGGTTPDFYDVAWNGTVFCAVDGISDTSYTSSNGISWTAHALPALSASYRCIAWNGSAFVTCGRSSSIALASADGINWTQYVLPYSTTWNFISTKGTLICVSNANGSRCAASSDNGATWTGAITTGIVGITASSSMFLSVDYSSTSTYRTSTDGLNWTSRSFPSTSSWNIVGYGNGFFVSDNATSVLFSTTGL